MDWDIMNKYDADGVAGGGSRSVVLDIDTDIVLENLASMSQVLTNEQQALLKGFSLSGAWSSSNATLVQEKVDLINASFKQMKEIIEKLQNKVNKYVENTVAADTVNFNNGEGGAE